MIHMNESRWSVVRSLLAVMSAVTGLASIALPAPVAILFAIIAITSAVTSLMITRRVGSS